MLLKLLKLLTAGQDGCF